MVMTQVPFRKHNALLLILAVVALASTPQLRAADIASSSVIPSSAERQVSAVMGSWVAAIAGKHTTDLTTLVDSKSESYYLQLRDMALEASVTELETLGEVDQLQVMFFRLMLEPQRLRAMNAAQLLAFAVEKGFIGMELRRADVLDETEISGESATGRLYKFGREDRPDRYKQYFVKEQGSWRVSLLGERARLEGEFDSFVQRTELSRSEAAFFILEMRLMRKVTPADFFDSRAVASSEAVIPPTISVDVPNWFRLVSVRLSETLIGRPAVTLDDARTGLKHVIQRGESVPDFPHIILQGVSSDVAVFENQKDSSAVFTLSLDSDDHLSRRVAFGRSAEKVQSSLIDEAALGVQYPGEMMMQWRNTGLRGRPQLLQQAWLTPDFGGELGPDKSMLGLKVNQVTPASFWDQVGLRDGDLLTAVNDLSLDTLDAWKTAIHFAETEQEFTVRLQRGRNELVFRTHTVKPG